MTLTVAVLIFILDRVTKYIAVNYLAPGQSAEIIRNIFHFTLVLNSGAAFGLFRGGTIVFIILSLLVIAFIVVYIFRQKTKDTAISVALGLVLGGAAGNLLDRARFGYVIDFLDFRVWPVFNIADSAITVGAALLVLRILFQAKGES